MPILNFFVIVGLALIGLLYVADAVLPHDTRLQVRSNFEGIPPAPQRQYTRSVLAPPPEFSPDAAVATPPADVLPQLRAPVLEMSSTSVPASMPLQAGEPSLLQAAESDLPSTAVAAASMPQAEEPRRIFKAASGRAAKRQLPYKNRKHVVHKREQREDGFASAEGGMNDWSWHENHHRLATERRWRTGGLRDRVWRDQYWR